MTIDITPIAYKFRAKKDGIVNEFVALKDIPIDEAQEMIKDFLEHFKILSIRKDMPTMAGVEVEIRTKEEYSVAKDRWAFLPEFMRTCSEEFSQKDYSDFMISKNLKFRRKRTPNDDLQCLKKWKLVEHTSVDKWKFIVSEEFLKSTIEEKTGNKKMVTQASIPPSKQREYLMYKNMGDKDYFTIRDWVEFMTTPPNNYEETRIKDNFYHDIQSLIHASKLKEIKKEDKKSYYPKRYKIIKVEPQFVEERMIKDLKEGQKVLLGTIKENMTR